ncbi:serine/threonine-protein kinase [Bowmanella denitrificans]|uniref:serine/threonine-protein kinase n=1 Tax=Bowmanella denitrificans TaxID=366582 RepID=UPI000C9A8029|nr:serine/threonine-protein kinase [Bowmanella denitrificans]
MESILAKMGHYQIGELLGSGSYGKVYKAFDERLQRAVAIKVLHHYHRQDLQLEAVLQAKLQHANIVAIYDIVEQAEARQTAIVMEFLPGPTLADKLNGGKLQTEQAICYALQIAKGLRVIHEAGFVHRDLKPENIFFDQHDSVKIGDFGIAKAVQQEGSGQLGNLYAPSPEQLAGAAVNGQSDLFALGVLMFHMLSGEHPLQRRGLSGDKWLESFLDAQFPQLASGHSVLDELVAELLQKSPLQRPLSAAKVVIRLRSILNADEQGGQNRTLELVNPLMAKAKHKRVTKRRRWLNSATAAVVLLMAVAIWQFWPQPSRYIAVLPPTVQTLKDVQDMPLIQAAIGQAVNMGIQHNPELKLIALDELDQWNSSDSVTDLLTITAADDVLQTQLDCIEAKCAVTLRLWRGDPAIVVRQEQTWIPVDRLLFVDDSVRQFVGRFFQQDGGTYFVHKVPDEPLYRDYLSIRLSYEQGRTTLDEYVQWLQRSVDRQCDYIEFCHALLMAYIQQYRQTRQQDWLDEGKEMLSLIADLDSKKTLMTDAIEHALVRKDFAQADHWLKKLEQQFAVDDSVLYLRARWYFQQNLQVKARLLMEQIIARRPASRHLYNYALMLYRAEQYKPAEQALTVLLNKDPAHAKAVQLMAVMQFYQGRWPEVISSYARLPDKDKKQDAGVLSNLGLAYLMQAQYDQAMRYLQQAYQLAPSNPIALLNLADALSLNGLTHQSREAYVQGKQLLEAIPSPSINEKLALAQIYAQLGLQEEAMAMLMQIEQLNSQDPFLLYSLSLVYCLLNELDTALVYKQKAIAAGIADGWFSLVWFSALPQAAASPSRVH